jgi:hypothetical protein
VLIIRKTRYLRSAIPMSIDDVITIHDLTVIRIRVHQQEDVSFVGGRAFSREGSSTVEVSGPKLVAITKLFLE